MACQRGAKRFAFVGIPGPSTGFLVLNAKNAIVSGLGLSQLLKVHVLPGLETGTEGNSSRVGFDSIDFSIYAVDSRFACLLAFEIPDSLSSER